jgi:hypothetical protein
MRKVLADLSLKSRQTGEQSKSKVTADKRLKHRVAVEKNNTIRNFI